MAKAIPAGPASLYDARTPPPRGVRVLIWGDVECVGFEVGYVDAHGIWTGDDGVSRGPRCWTWMPDEPSGSMPFEPYVRDADGP